METLHQDLLHILKSALQGHQLSSFDERPADFWERLAILAGEHKVLPLVYDAVRLLPQLQGTPILAQLRQQSLQQIVLQAQKSYDFLNVYQKLLQANAAPLVVKGIVCRQLYPQPDYRPSSDEDLLTAPQQFSLCHDLLLQQGLHTAATAQQLEKDYEIPYRCAASPLFLELHRQLFPPESEAYSDLNCFFEGVFQRAIPQEIQGTTVYTMSHTDHLFYLICHAFKHFLHSGFGIRQVCDMALYANAYGSRIDWAQILDNCRRIRADKFAAALFRIGKNYLVFDPDQAAYPDAWRQIPVDELPMLEDLLCGGVYGSAQLSRSHSSNITLDAVAAQKQGKKSKNALLASAFPSAAKLEGRYPYLKKRPWLLPVAWCSRIWAYGKETRSSRNNNAADALKIGTTRIDLLKEYGIL